MAKRRKSMMDMMNSNTRSTTEALFGNADELDSLGENNLNKTLKDTDHLDLAMIDIEDLIDNTQNTFKVENLTMLVESIRQRGLLQPLVVLPILGEDDLPTGKYEIKSGSRRYASILQIVREAERKGDEETANTFRDVPCYMLPKGATEDEVAAVVVETNTTARQITVEDVFRNFDIIFDKEADGTYKYLPEGGGTIDAVMKMLSEMGLEFKKSSVNDYIAIYFAHNQEIKKALEQGIISKKNAVTVARMSDSEQDKFMEYLKELDDSGFREKLKEYRDSKKKKKSTSYIKGAEALTRLEKLKKNVARMNLKKQYVFSDQMQKTRVKAQINEIRSLIDQMEDYIDNSRAEQQYQNKRGS